MVLGLIWFLSHLWVVEVILASSFREREREKGRLWHFLRWRPLKADPAGELGKIQESPFLERSKSLAAVKAKSLLRCRLFILSLFLLHILDRCLPLMFSFFAFGKFSFFASFQWKTVVLVGLICLLFSFFSLQIHEEEEKLAASLYQWKTVVPLVAPLSRHSGYSSERLEGFSLFKVQIFLPFFFFLVFLSFALPRLLLVERQWVLGSEMPSPSWNCLL